MLCLHGRSNRSQRVPLSLSISLDLFLLLFFLLLVLLFSSPTTSLPPLLHSLTPPQATAPRELRMAAKGTPALSGKDFECGKEIPKLTTEKIARKAGYQSSVETGQFTTLHPRLDASGDKVKTVITSQFACQCVHLFLKSCMVWTS